MHLSALFLIRAAVCSSVGYQNQSGCIFFLFVSLFHGLLMGSRPSFRIQRHAALLMIIRSASNRFTVDSPTAVWLVHSPPDCHEAESICWSPGGGESFKFAQQVVSVVLTQCCHAEKKETLEEFSFLLQQQLKLAGSRVRIDTPLRSIGADGVQEQQQLVRRERRQG